MGRPFSERVAGEVWRREVEDWIGRQLDAAGQTATGAITQPRIRPWSTQLVVPTDADESWRLDVSQAPAVATRRTTARAEADQDADVVLRASSVALYLALWNRSDEVDAAPDFADLWRSQSSVSWS